MRAGVVGASGYTGAELVRLLGAHPNLTLTLATSREFAGRRIADVYPNLHSDVAFSELDAGALEDCDIAFLALPHGASMELGARLHRAGVAVIDLSADFRLHDPAAYPEWFGSAHSAPETLGEWVYGLPELHHAQIAGARAVANPGCYPTATLLAIAPLVAVGMIDPATIVVSAASGVSGAGRGVNAGVHFSHVSANFKAYGLPAHKHTPEIEQELSLLAGAPVTISFVPHLVPMSRGLLATCIATKVTAGDAADVAKAFYEGSPFVQILRDVLPETSFTLGTNRAHIGYIDDQRTGRIIAIAAIDNLGKGAAGQAIQNANIMLGFAEAAGLSGDGIYP